MAEARAAREMLLLGSSVKVAPIVEWDGQPIGDGKPGPVARALLELIEEDMRTGDRLIDVPYDGDPRLSANFRPRLRNSNSVHHPPGRLVNPRAAERARPVEDGVPDVRLAERDHTQLLRGNPFEPAGRELESIAVARLEERDGDTLLDSPSSGTPGHCVRCRVANRATSQRDAE